MRISVNLATRPFVELRPLFARLRLAMIVLAVLAIGLAFGLRSLNAKARKAQAEMDALKAKTMQFQQERQKNEQRMRQPQNMAVLERSRFLNAVFAQKSFSWTAVMMDLEKVLPAGVQVTSIEPVVSKEGEVSIRLRVGGDRERGVQLLRNLETSQRFIAPRLASEAAQTREGSNRAGAPPSAPGDVEFEIFSRYNPLPAAAVKQVKAGNESKDSTVKAGQNASKTPRRAKKPKMVPPAGKAQMGGQR